MYFFLIQGLICLYDLYIWLKNIENDGCWDLIVSIPPEYFDGPITKQIVLSIFISKYLIKRNKNLSYEEFLRILKRFSRKDTHISLGQKDSYYYIKFKLNKTRKMIL